MGFFLSPPFRHYFFFLTTSGSYYNALFQVTDNVFHKIRFQCICYLYPLCQQASTLRDCYFHTHFPGFQCFVFDAKESSSLISNKLCLLYYLILYCGWLFNALKHLMRAAIS